MKRLIHSCFAAAILLHSGATTGRADEASEAKLRNQVKTLTQQLRTVQTEKAAVETAKMEEEHKTKTLEKQVKDLGKQREELDATLKAEKKSAEEIQARQTAEIQRLTEELKKHKASLDKWQAAHTQIVDIAKKKEAERAKCSAKAADLERRVAELRAKNLELYKLGTEILSRYEKFGIGEALAAREPFTGNAKVKLQNIVQDYGDKLLNQSAAKP